MSDNTTAIAVRETTDAAQAVTALTITSQEGYGLMLAAVKAVKGLIKKITDHHGPMKAKAYAAWKEVCAGETRLLAPLQEAEKLGKRRMDAWDDEIERKAKEEAARLRREAEEQERKERAKQAAKLEAEARARAAEAEKLAAKGKAEAAEAARRAAANATAKAAAVVAAPSEVPIITVDVPKETGTTRKEIWGAYEIEDPTLIPREYLMPDHDKLKRYGQAMRADAKVAGVRFYPTSQRSVSA